LLHDVGKLVLGLRLKDTYWSMLDEAAANGESAAAIEIEALGCHHGTVGGWLLQLWQLPPEVIDPVARHHEPLAAEFGLDLSAVVAVANRLVDATDPNNGQVRQEVLAEIRAFAPGLLGSEEWRDMYSGLNREQQAMASIFAA
jgi:HD-like signal output (HDOD) protein